MGSRRLPAQGKPKDCVARLRIHLKSPFGAAVRSAFQTEITSEWPVATWLALQRRLNLSHNVKRASRKVVATCAVGLCVFGASGQRLDADDSVGPTVRYQLLSIAVEASWSCEWARQELGSYILARREQLAANILRQDLTDPADLAVIRKRARRIFLSEGCQSQAIADLFATVRRVEGD